MRTKTALTALLTPVILIYRLGSAQSAELSADEMIAVLHRYKPTARIDDALNENQRRAVHRELNYTRRQSFEGFECMAYLQSANVSDYFVSWFVTDGGAVSNLERNTFECTQQTKALEILNCDPTIPRSMRNGEPVIPSVDVFDGTHGCADLIAAMNIIHGEDVDDDRPSYDGGRRLADSDSYPTTCSGQWRSCPYNVFFTGMISPIVTTSDQRFHQHAHNIQGNHKGWQSCTSSHYVDMPVWPRYQRATYFTNFGTLIDIYEGGSMQKCALQGAWYVHIKGYAFGQFCATQEIRAKSTHTCEQRYRSGSNYCFSSDTGYCLMDFETVKNDATKCNALQSGPRTIQHKNSWCCGACA